MPVLESPIYHDWPVPPLGPQRYGYLVWLRLDPKASVSLLEDEEATRAAALLPRDWYLGFILGDARAMQYNSERKMLLSLGFALLGEGPSHIESHSIPIAPALPYSDKRPPVELASPLPWANLYVHTHVNAGGIICRIHHGAGRFEPVLSEEARSRVYRAYFADTIAYQNAKVAASHPEEVYAVAPDATDAGPDGEWDGTEDDASSEKSLKFDTRSIDATFDRVHGNVEVWLDPASYPGPPANPDTWLATLERLRAIWNDWRDRRYAEAKTRGPRKTDAWLQGVDAAIDLPHEYDHDAALEPPLDDDAVLPEDAVDYRIEQEYDGKSGAVLFAHAHAYLDTARSESTVSSLSSLHSQSDLNEHKKPLDAIPSLKPAVVDQPVSRLVGQAHEGASPPAPDASPGMPSPTPPLPANSAQAPDGAVSAREDKPVQSPSAPARPISGNACCNNQQPAAVKGRFKAVWWPIKAVRGALSHARIGFTRRFITKSRNDIPG